MLCLNVSLDQKTLADRLRADLRQLDAELARQQSLQSELKRLSVENKALARQTQAAGEMAELRAKAGELNRLKGENDLLRSEMERAKADLAAGVQNRSAEQEENGTEGFTTSGSIVVKPGQTAIMGGWDTGNGKRAFAFASPEALIDGNGVKIGIKWVETKEATARELGLAGLFTGSRQTTGFLTADGDAYRSILDTLSRREGTDVLSFPDVTTTYGRQIHVETSPNTGPSLDAIPYLQPDGSIKMTVIGRLILKPVQQPKGAFRSE